MDNLEFFLTGVYQVDLSFPWVKMSDICTDQVISCIWTIWYVVDVKHLAVSVTLPDPPASETCYKPLCKVKFTANKNWFTTREVPSSTCNAIVWHWEILRPNPLLCNNMWCATTQHACNRTCIGNHQYLVDTKWDYNLRFDIHVIDSWNRGTLQTQTL